MQQKSDGIDQDHRTNPCAISGVFRSWVEMTDPYELAMSTNFSHFLLLQSGVSHTNVDVLNLKHNDANITVCMIVIGGNVGLSKKIEVGVKYTNTMNMKDQEAGLGNVRPVVI